MPTVKSYACFGPGQELEPFEFELPKPKGTQVVVRVKYCGICYSDVAMIDNEWGISSYPLVPGHEVIGEVVQVGPKVTQLKVGDTVGVGWYSASCGTCHECVEEEQQLCASTESTIVHRHGGFAERLLCEETWAVKIPKSLQTPETAPLFCGGITVFDPILINKIEAHHKVAVVGFGGLGHLAIQFLHHWGCDVTVFSRAHSKSEDASKFGAGELVETHNTEELLQHTREFDLILVTSYADLEWPLYLNALRPKGTIHIVGAVPNPIPVPAFSLISGQKSIAGSALGSPKTVKKMLNFSAKHKVAAQIERFKMSEVNQAIKRLREGDVRYRVVLDADF